jgi:hypothetical protein
MPWKSLIVIVGLAAPLLVGAAAPALAQTSLTAQNEPAVSAPPRVRRHIEITPRPLLYRRCTDWYELQYQPSGTVLFPQKRCWWVRG